MEQLDKIEEIPNEEDMLQIEDISEQKIKKSLFNMPTPCIFFSAFTVVICTVTGIVLYKKYQK